MVVEMGFDEFSFYIVQICIGLFAIRRSDTTNYAMFDPDGARSFLLLFDFDLPSVLSEPLAQSVNHTRARLVERSS